MDESMSRYERIQAAMNLKEADRVPVDPLNIYILGYQGGATLKEYITDPVKATKAAEIARKKIGEGDQVNPNLTGRDHLAFPPISAWDQYTACWEIFDDFPPKGNIPNFYEKPIIEDYDDVMERGFSTLLWNKKISKKTLNMSVDDFLYYSFEFPKIHAREWAAFAERNQVPLLAGARSCITYDLAMYYRGITNFARDIREQPAKVKEFCDWLIEYETTWAMRRAEIMGAGKVPGADKIFFLDSRAAPPDASPAIFQEFFWPTVKKGIDIFVKRGYKPHVHIDGDLTRVLESMSNITKGIPKGKVVLDLEKTDMKKAKEVLGDKVCLYGNVPASLLVYGTVHDVKGYCKKLIEDCAEGGGYILSTECETPWNAKPENVKAMIDSAKEFGQYRR